VHRLPPQRLTFQPRRSPGIPFNNEYVQGNQALDILVRKGHQIAGSVNHDANFFGKFPNQALVGGFRRNKLAAGELPPTRLVRTGWALRNQNSTLIVRQDTRGNMD